MTAMPRSHKTDLSCLGRVGGVSGTSDKSRLSTIEKSKMSKLFCAVSKCGVNRVLSCLDPVSNLQLGLVCKRVHSADRTGQNCLVSNISRTTENSLDLSPIQFTPPTRQDKTVLSVRLCGVNYRHCCYHCYSNTR